MIQTENSLFDNNKYDEYLYLDGKLEKVGAWQTDLSDYVTKTEFNGLSSKVNNLETLLNGKVEEIEAINATIGTISADVTGLKSHVENLAGILNSDYFITKEDYEVALELDE